ncbi:MAG TPA: heme-binding protein [Casimicrobiaceae bacterium]|nr:heme-binding protein [Casimicrobiaceae bacterium]
MPSLRLIPHAAAGAAVDAIRKELERRGQAAVIAIADAHGELIALLRMDGAPLGSIGVACNKAYTAARLRRTTREHGARIEKRGADIAYYGDPRYTGFGGGVPVMVDGVTLGAIGVSALTDEEDEALAALGVALLAEAAAKG